MRSLRLAAALALALPLALHAQYVGTLSEADAISAARTFVTAMARGDFVTAVARFDATMKAALPVDRLSNTWERLELQVGAFSRIETAALLPRPDVRAVVTTCVFERARIDIQTTFNALGEVSGLYFRPAASAAAVETAPPPYVRAGSYTESDITVGAGTTWALPGTLTMPAGAGPFPAVVLVHGSGPGDRDETVGANKPFRDVALGLASRGIASIRYDKRTRVHAGTLPPRFTVKEETVDDAAAAVALARTTRGIDPARVFVLGHSLGGQLVPRIARAAAAVRGLIVMAGPARGLDEMLHDQVRYLAGLDGTVTAEEQAQIDAVAALRSAVAALTPADAVRTDLLGGAPPAYWLDLRAYDAPAAASTLEHPLLVLQGDRDYQVTMDDFARWQAALAGKSSATLRAYPGLNHLFMPGTGPASPEDYARPGHVAQAVIEDIAAWIAGQR